MAEFELTIKVVIETKAYGGASFLNIAKSMIAKNGLQER